jgi:hypothetical protein
MKILLICNILPPNESATAILLGKSFEVCSPGFVTESIIKN